MRTDKSAEKCQEMEKRELGLGKYFLLGYFYFYSCVCAYLSVYVWVSVEVIRGRVRAPGAVVKAVVSHLRWVLGTELGSIGRAASAVNG